jgi:hemolysin activation/secretion protein
MKTSTPFHVPDSTPGNLAQSLVKTQTARQASHLFTRKALVVALLGAGLMGPAWAQTAIPDAGSTLREELRRNQPAPATPVPAGTAAQAPDSRADTGPRLAVSAFRVQGLHALSEQTASRFLEPYAGKSYSMEGLHKVAEAFEQWLRGRGLFTARAYVPPQDIAGGVVEIRVLQGHLEGIDIKSAPGTRLSDDTLRRFLAGSLPPGSALQQDQLERGLLLLNDMPATSARAVLTPGKELGGSRVVVEAAQGPVYSGSVDVDNTGNRYTGSYRFGAALSVNDAYGLADQWSLRGSASQGSAFVRAAYNLPLDNTGLRAGLSWIGSNYRLCCEETIKSLDANGKATAASLFLSYPMVRGRMDNLHSFLSLSSRSFVNKSLGQTLSDKSSTVFTLAVGGDHSDVLGLTQLGAYTTYGLQVSGGNLKLGRVPADKAQDAVTAKTQGGFGKLTAQVAQTLRISKDSTLNASLSIQRASKNLDSSEKFSLGGAQGVRAYPTGEASGDEGLLLSIEYRKEFNRDLGLIAFLDAGQITLHKTLWDGALAANGPSNSYGLAGLGASVVYSPMNNTQVTGTLATRLGANPARDAKGNNSDGRSERWRLWLQASVGF